MTYQNKLKALLTLTALLIPICFAFIIYNIDKTVNSTGNVVFLYAALTIGWTVLFLRNSRTAHNVYQSLQEDKQR